MEKWRGDNDLAQAWSLKQTWQWLWGKGGSGGKPEASNNYQKGEVGPKKLLQAASPRVFWLFLVMCIPADAQALCNKFLTWYQILGTLANFSHKLGPKCCHQMAV